MASQPAGNAMFLRYPLLWIEFSGWGKYLHRRCHCLQFRTLWYCNEMHKASHLMRPLDLRDKGRGGMVRHKKQFWQILGYYCGQVQMEWTQSWSAEAGNAGLIYWVTSGFLNSGASGLLFYRTNSCSPVSSSAETEGKHKHGHLPFGTWCSMWGNCIL